ncbi:MAG TPA: ABC transporter permease [Candidatus Nitrosotalea sp.]|nr:ABC transporter permease [Candidatus Nitrosotalea sp.]
MTFLPIVERELRVAARRRGTYWSRAASALVAIVICAWLFLFTARTDPVRELGKTLFYILSVIFFGSGLLAGVRFTADTLSEEKREGTLGLLFLTDLKGYDVVLGKLVASSMSAFYGLLAIFPVMAIPLLLGGVAPAEFWRMTLVLSNTLFFSLATGLFISSVSRDPRRAMAGTLLTILAINGLTPAVGLYLAHVYNAREVDDVFLIPCAGFAYRLVFDGAYRTSADQFLWSILFTQCCAWVFLIFASIASRYSWRDKPAGATTARLRDRWNRWVNGDEQQRKRFRTRLLDQSPCYWLGGRDRLKPALVWGVIGLAAAFWLWGFFKWRQDWVSEGINLITAVLMHTMLKVWIASEACQKLGRDHRNGALELVLSTPLSVSEILRGQILSLRRQFLWPICFVVLVDLNFLMTGLRHEGLGGDNSWAWVCLAGITVFVADVYTICWVGLWVGLTARRANRATANTVMRVMVLPWFVWFIVVLCASLIALLTRFENEPEYLLGLWFVLSMVNDAAFYLWTRRRLHQDLREVATRRFSWSRPRLWPFSLWRGTAASGESAVAAGGM